MELSVTAKKFYNNINQVTTEPSPNIHTTYTIYLLFEGFVVPVIIIISVRNIKKHCLEKVNNFFKNLKFKIPLMMRKRMITPML